MAKQAGRLATLKVGATTIAAVRVLGLSAAKGAIDTTTADEGAVQTFLKGQLATDTLEVTVQGLADDDELRKRALKTEGGAFIEDAEFVFPTGDKISGDFVMTAYSENAPHDNVIDFNATFVRNGAHTWTDKPAG